MLFKSTKQIKGQRIWGKCVLKLIQSMFDIVRQWNEKTFTILNLLKRTKGEGVELNLYDAKVLRRPAITDGSRRPGCSSTKGNYKTFYYRTAEHLHPLVACHCGRLVRCMQ